MHLSTGHVHGNCRYAVTQNCWEERRPLDNVVHWGCLCLFAATRQVYPALPGSCRVRACLAGEAGREAAVLVDLRELRQLVRARSRALLLLPALLRNVRLLRIPGTTHAQHSLRGVGKPLFLPWCQAGAWARICVAILRVSVSFIAGSTWAGKQTREHIPPAEDIARRGLGALSVAWHSALLK